LLGKMHALSGMARARRWRVDPIRPGHLKALLKQGAETGASVVDPATGEASKVAAVTPRAFARPILARPILTRPGIERTFPWRAR